MTDDATPEGVPPEGGPPEGAPAQPVPAGAANQAGAANPADAAGPPPVSPDAPWQTGTRVDQLATWVLPLRSSFTDAALERTAIAGGFTAEEVREALALADARQRTDETMVPVRSMAKRIVLGAYGLVWILFAIPYLLRGTQYGLGPILQIVLTMSLVLGLAFSFVIMRALHPDPTRARRALTILLVMPVIVLLGISGLCLPFAASSGQV